MCLKANQKESVKKKKRITIERVKPTQKGVQQEGWYSLKCSLANWVWRMNEMRNDVSS